MPTNGATGGTRSARKLHIEAVRTKIRPVTKTSISENIAQQILNLIANGELKPGQHLPSERDLCKVFGAGRSSVREALRCLSMLGILDARVGEGTIAAVDSGKFLNKVLEWRLITEQHDIENLLQVRIALEGVAVADAARVRTDADLVKLEALIEKMERFVTSEKKFARIDLEFHLALSKISGNSLLFDMVSMIRKQLVDGLSRVLPLPNALPLSLKEHKAILKAIQRGDAEAARLAMQDHICAALERHRENMNHAAANGTKAPRRVARAAP